MKAIPTFLSTFAIVLASPSITDRCVACDCAVRDSISISIESVEVNGAKVEPKGYDEFVVHVSYESGRTTLFASRNSGTASYEGTYEKK